MRENPELHYLVVFVFDHKHTHTCGYTIFSCSRVVTISHNIVIYSYSNTYIIIQL